MRGGIDRDESWDSSRSRLITSAPVVEVASRNRLKRDCLTRPDIPAGVTSDGLTEMKMRFADTLLTALLCGQGLLGLAAIAVVALKTPATPTDATRASVSDAR